MLNKKTDILKKLSPNPFVSNQTGGKDMGNAINDDEFFLRRVLHENHEQGIELLYKRYFQPLCSHAIKYVGSKSVAEDIVSEIFLQFYAKKAYLNIETSYRYYLYRAVRNNSFNYIQREFKKTESIEEMPNFDYSDSESPYSISRFEEMYQDVQNAVNKLPFDRRKIYLLNRFEGKKYAEIAEELHLSIKTVEVQLYRANKFIRSLLKEKWMLSFFILFIDKN